MKKIILTIIACLFCVGTALADEQYGGYERPTHFPDYHSPAYANNMSYMMAAVTPDGVRIQNYEVACYDQNDQLRAICRSLSKDQDCCLITIQGTEGDTFHFEVVYGDFDNPTVKAVPETCEFHTNAFVGSLSSPFFLTVPSEPRVQYWTTSLTGDATGEVALSEITSSTLAGAKRIALKGSWGDESISDLLDGCKELQILEMATLPGTTAEAFTGTNPNCLKFLPSGTTEAPEGWTNCIADDKALTDITLTDGTPAQPCPFFCPADIDLNGKKAVFRRTSPWCYANGKGGWNTLILPFDAKVQADGEDVQVLKRLSPYDTQWKKENGYWACYMEYGKPNNLAFTLVNTIGLSANTPYLFALPNHNFEKEIDGVTYSLNMEEKDITFVSTGSTLPATPAGLLISQDEDQDETDCHFVGTFQTIVAQPLYMLKTNMNTDYDAFIYREQGNVLPFRGYLAMKEGNEPNEVRAIAMGWEYGNDADAITNIAVDDQSAPSLIYDLSGRRLTSIPSNGVYIINGRKVIR